jgi:pimeloyl-ACP methyl ester carboxylesterase
LDVKYNTLTKITGPNILTADGKVAGGMKGPGVITIEETIATGDLPVRADLRTSTPGDERPVVVVCPGFMGYRRWGFFPWVSGRLAQAGFHVVTISFSHDGTDDATGMITRPDEFATNKVSIELRDLQAVLEYSRSGEFPFRAARRVGLLGHSRGGSVCVLAASGSPLVGSLVTWSTPTRLDRYTERRKTEWKMTGSLIFADDRSPEPLRLDYSYYEDIDDNRERFDIPAVAASLTIPHLVVHGERDAAVSINEAGAFFDIPRAGESSMVPIRGCGHTFGIGHPMSAVTPALEKAAGLTVEWLAKTLAATGANPAAAGLEHDGG